MKHGNELWKHAAAFFICFGLAGCVSEHCYDISGMEPFAQYSGRDVVFTQDAILIAKRFSQGSKLLPMSDNRTSFILSYPGDYASRRGDAVLVVRAGTAVHVDKTIFESSNQGFTQAFFHTEDLATGVEIPLDAPDWPARVYATFYPTPGRITTFALIVGTERPKRQSPWLFRFIANAGSRLFSGVLTKTNLNGTVHTYSYDSLGRQTLDW